MLNSKFRLYFLHKVKNAIDKQKHSNYLKIEEDLVEDHGEDLKLITNSICYVPYG